MGSCFSKDVNDEKVGGGTQRLGSKPVVNEKTSVQTTANGHKLGGQDPQSAREAVALAAESRYNQSQDKGKESKAKLEAMKKMSKQDKGL